MHEIAFRDLCVWTSVAVFPTRGALTVCWMPVEMPRLPPHTLDCAGYLYGCEDDARSGSDFGGTAFFVSMPARHSGRCYVYAVTNHHVACTGGASVLRVNTRNGGVEIFPFEPSDWEFDSRYDIAVIPLSLNESHKFGILPSASFITRESIEHAKIEAGDDVFMIGRFIDHDGGPVNRPAVRFGNISVMPSPIEQPNGLEAESYCIDLHSRSGYSGSPVFVYRLSGHDLTPTRQTNDPVEVLSRVALQGNHVFGLLGIHSSQFPERWELTSGGAKIEHEAGAVPLVREGAYVKGLSGMTCVLPAWYILEVLNLPRLKKHREWQDSIEEQKRLREGAPLGPEITPEIS